MKKRIHLVQVTGEAPKSFRFYPRLVYSALTRSRGRQSTVSKLHRSLGLSRDAVARARDTLVTLGLATVGKGRLTALNPKGVYDADGATVESDRSAWFYYLKNEPIWWRAFQYFKFPAPSNSCPMEHRGCAVLGYLGYRAWNTVTAKNITYSYVGVKVGIDYRTVVKVLVVLDDAGFLEHTRRADRDVFSVKIDDLMARPDWFLDKTETTDLAPKKPRIAAKVGPIPSQEVGLPEDGIYDIIDCKNNNEYHPGDYGGWYPNIDLEVEYSEHEKSGNLRAGRPEVGSDTGGGDAPDEGLLRPGEVAGGTLPPLDFGAVIEVGPGQDDFDVTYRDDEIQPYTNGTPIAPVEWKNNEEFFQFLKSM